METPYSESGEVLEQLPREAVDAPSIPGGVEGQVGWGPGQADVLGGNQPTTGIWNWMIFKVSFSLCYSMVL